MNTAHHDPLQAPRLLAAVAIGATLGGLLILVLTPRIIDAAPTPELGRLAPAEGAGALSASPRRAASNVAGIGADFVRTYEITKNATRKKVSLPPLTLGAETLDDFLETISSTEIDFSNCDSGSCLFLLVNVLETEPEGARHGTRILKYTVAVESAGATIASDTLALSDGLGSVALEIPFAALTVDTAISVNPVKGGRYAIGTEVEVYYGLLRPDFGR